MHDDHHGPRWLPATALDILALSAASVASLGAKTTSSCVQSEISIFERIHLLMICRSVPVVPKVFSDTLLSADALDIESSPTRNTPSTGVENRAGYQPIQNDSQQIITYMHGD